MADKRKFERLTARLEVEIRTRGRGQVCPSVDVSRHGMFLTTANPPHERQLLILRIPLPEGLPAIDVMASVVRRVTPEEARERDAPGGIGINFFALTEENKAHWEQYLARLRGQTVQLPSLSDQNASRATFLLQPKDVERLRLFAARELALGSMFLRTPVLRPVGETIKVILLHPMSDEEFPLLAKVRSIHEGTPTEPKGMTLDFAPLAEELRGAIGDFVEHGLPPHGTNPIEAAEVVPATEAEEASRQLAAAQETPAIPAPEEAQQETQDETPEGITEEAREATPPAAPRAEVDREAEPAAEALASAAAAAPQLPEIEALQPGDVATLFAAAPPPVTTPAVEGDAGSLLAAPETVAPNELSQSETHPGPTRAIEPDAPPTPAAPGEATPQRGPAGLERATTETTVVVQLRGALAAAPEDVGMLFRLGCALANEPATAIEALSLLQRLQELEPHHPLANGAIALAYAQLGERSAAERHVTRARRLGQPIDARVHSLLKASAAAQH